MCKGKIMIYAIRNHNIFFVTPQLSKKSGRAECHKRFTLSTSWPITPCVFASYKKGSIAFMYAQHNRIMKL